MTVKMDFDKVAEVSPDKARHIDYDYAVDSPNGVRAERVIATGNGLTQQALKTASPKAELAFYSNAPQQDFPPAKGIVVPELAQSAKRQHDCGIGS